MSAAQKGKMRDACCDGRVGEVEQLLKEAPSLLNASLTGYGSTPLHYASENGQTEVVRLLLASNADPNKQDKYGSTPLHEASKKGKTEVVRLLLASNADPNLQNEVGQTPLHLASQYGQTKVGKLLLASNVDINKQDKYGSTPLHMASYNGKTEVVRLLLASNADPNLQNEYGDTPLHLASQYGKTEIVKLLLASNADPNIKNTPQHWMMLNGLKPGDWFEYDVTAATKQEIQQLLDKERKKRNEAQQQKSTTSSSSSSSISSPSSAASSSLKSTTSYSSSSFISFLSSAASSFLVSETQEAERIGAIKCKFGEDAARFSVTKTTTFEELIAMVEGEWGEGKGLKFKDCDGDWLKMKNNDDVVEVWNQTKSGVVTLKVFTQQNLSPSSSSPPELSAPEDMAFENSKEPPPARCFQKAPELNFEDSLKALLQGPKELPPDRNDLEIANDDILGSLLYCCEDIYEQKMLEHPDLMGLLEKDQALAIIAYTCEHPYKVYFWLNAWLMQDRRDQGVVNNVGPFFRLFYQGLEKLPRTTLKASRAVKVKNIPRFQKLFQNPPNKGEKYSFWGIPSFSVKDEIVGEFSGKGEEKAIVFSCGDLECVSIEKLSAQEREAEVIPLPPAIFKVSTTYTHSNTKLFIALDHKPKDHVYCSYLPPTSPKK